MFRNLIHRLSDYFDKLALIGHFNSIMHFIGVMIAAHIAAKAHPIKNHNWNMWYCIILFNVVYIITIAIDYEKLDYDMEQMASPIKDIEKTAEKLVKKIHLG